MSMDNEKKEEVDGELFFKRLRLAREKEEKLAAANGGKLAEKVEDKSMPMKKEGPNKKERRLARKLLVEEEAAKAEEMLKQENASMLPRKRKRMAQNAINFAAQEEERLERGRIIEQAKQDLKEPNMSRKQRRAAEKVIAQAAEEKKLLRIKKREEREAAELEQIRIDKIQADNTAKEEKVGSP